MPEGLSVALANGLLSGSDAEVADYTWLKLHVGAPGSAGTANAATETTRKQITWGSPASGSMASVTADLVWTSISGSQDATHCTVWDASTAGNFGVSGVITANAYTAGDTLTIPAGSVTASFTTAS